MTPDDVDSTSPRTAPAFAELSGKAQERIDQACDEFEAAWQAVVTRPDQSAVPPDGWPALARCIANLTGGERTAALRELVPIDVSYRRRCGAPVTIADYASFADLDAEWLSQVVLNPDGETRRIHRVSETPLPPPRANAEPIRLDDYVERLTESGVLDHATIERELAAFRLQASGVASAPRSSSEITDNNDTGGLTPPRSPVGLQHTTDELGQRLIALGLLTPFQHASLMQPSPLRLVLGDYVLLSPLGQGGMGTVYRARHQRMDRIVAVKVLPRSTAHDPHVANRFRREIRAVSRLSHPHIVAAHDAGEDDGVMYLVMECIDGLDLSTWVRRHGPLCVADAVECIAQAADGMEYAHQQGIIHRDIKPSNLLRGEERGARGERESQDADSSVLSSRLLIKVLDLGLARFDAEPAAVPEATAITRSGMIFGTAEYMSPEQAINVSSADQRSDIYSLGCTLFFLLTGRPVVTGETYMEMVMAHQLLTLPSLSSARRDVPDELDQIFRRMTVRQPEQRFASMREVRDALRAIPADRLAFATAAPVTRSNGGAAPLAGATEWIAPLQLADAGSNRMRPTDQVTEPDQQPVTGELISRSRVAEVAERSPVAPQSSLTLRALRLCVRPVMVIVRRQGIRRTLAAVVVFVLLVRVLIEFLPPVGPPSRNEELVPHPLAFPATERVAQQTQRAWAAHLTTQTSLPNSIGLTMILIPPGEFTMGTTEAEFHTLSALIPNADELSTVDNERPSRRVRLQRPFWIGQTEITVGQFRQFVEDADYTTDAEKTAGYGVVNNQWVLQPGFSWKNTGEQSLTDNHPVCNLNWNDAVALCEWLTSRESQAGKSAKYRLPTEAEWEYACRAGTETPWFFGSDPTRLPEFAVTFANSNNRHHPAKTRQPNPFGLFDLYGNESEWCHDLFAPYASTDAERLDPAGPANPKPVPDSERVQRGGSFNFPFHRQRSAAREGHPADSPMHGGVRVLREP